MYKNVFYLFNFAPIGGTETFIYYLCKKYKAKDITVMYKTGDPFQIARLKQYVRVVKWNGEHIECERLFVSYRDDIIPFVDAKEYIGIMHADFLTLGFPLHPHPKITKWIGVSQAICDSFTKQTGLPCELCYNPLETEEPRKILKLISTTRLTWEKGSKRMEKFSKILEKAGVPYIWIIFTDTPEQERIKNPNLIYKDPVQDNSYLMGFVKEADYLVQFSNSEAYCYAVADALKIGVPVLVTDCPVYKELGIENGKNGYIFDFELENVDVNAVYNKIPSKFNFEPPKDKWNELLVEGESEYQKELTTMVYIVALIDYLDVEYQKIMHPTDLPYKTNLARAKELEKIGFAKIVSEP